MMKVITQEHYLLMFRNSLVVLYLENRSNMRGKRFTRHGKIPVSEDADNHNNMKQNISTYWKKSKAGKIRWENKYGKKNEKTN